MLLQCCEYGAYMAQVVCPGGTVYQNVIKKHENEPTEERAENIIHKGLERRRRVAQSERHDEELVESVVSPERRLVDIRRLHANLMVPRAQVQFGEEARALELVEQLVDDGDRESVLDSERIQRPIDSRRRTARNRPAS
jgi:hypothetical protein